ncbi:unnamed protein product [Bursaphelenchus okinawaensis]|uniref:EF-hand domain-containing protein n=1 Tax=Bursaphelenchus okinawaensis TaxID=465554 RepID=A0A811KSR5_9BILA|nr:unnamed protein product [Bursaphelenchus okinawaensis]CAG9111650.1 unnamed protein product [Bursaphelenchus okinawaensis]
MSFGQKPAAWGRQPAPQNQQLNPNLFANPLGAQLGQQFGGQVNPMQLGNINALVNPAAFGGNINNLNMIAQARQLMPPQQQPPQQQQGRASSPQGAKQPNQRTFVGTVTKMMETYGFIDEDVFFQTSVIRGPPPRIGDRVMVDATFNPSMPFKWNGYRVQLIQDAAPSIQPPSREHGRWEGNDRPAREEHRSSDRRQGSRRSPARRERSPVRRSPQVRKERSPALKRASPKRETVKRERERSPRPSREPKTRTPVPSKGRDADSPPRRRQRIIPRYQCYVPRPFIDSFAHYTYLHKRYPNLYIPSDFVRVDLSWPKSFNLGEPISFAPAGVPFSILSKSVDYPGDDLPSEQPSDADSKYLVKVLLLSHPGAALIRQKTTGLLVDGTIDEAQECQNFSKVLQLLVGMRGKSEFMGIGGAWSPSLDGEDPLDPQTLINTAVRTTKATTGVDLQKCPVWYQMAQIHYNRGDRRDLVTLMLPDVSSTPDLCPTSEAYKTLVEEVLPAQLQTKLAAIEAEEFKPSEELVKKLGIGQEEKKEEQQESEKATETEKAAEEPNNGAGDANETTQTTAADDATNGTTEPTNGTTEPTNGTTEVKNGTTETEKAPEAEEKNGNEEKEAEKTDASQESEELKPTHWSELIVKAMKVADLREELELRKIDSRGVKNALAQRLQESLDKEKEEEEANASQGDLIMTDEVAEEAASAEQKEVVEEEKKETVPEAKEEELVEKMETEEPVVTEEPKEEKPKYESDPAYKKELDTFEKQKKQRKAELEKQYSFPKEPSVLVYPSKTAKSGKFTCKLSSLQTVLDYRHDDNKEASFEVFVFAEALKEAIDRSNAFGVFYYLNSILDKEGEKTRRDEALAKPDEKEVKAEEEENKDENKEEKKEVTEEGSEKEEKEKKDSKKEDKKDEKKDEKKEEKKESVDLRTQFRALVNNVNAFQVFSHFDINGCGYLTDRDLEEVVNSIGLDISRSSISKIVKKVSSRDRFNYRNITDKWVDKDGNAKYISELVPDAPSREELYKTYVADVKVSDATPASTSTPDVTATGVVFYKGTVLNITQSLEAKKIVEDERSEALLKIEQLEANLKNVKDQRDRYDKKRKYLEEDVEKYKKRLHDAEKCLKNSQDDTVLMKSSLLDVKKLGERLQGIVDRVLPPPKKEKKEEKKEKSKEEKDDKDSKKDDKEATKSDEKSDNAENNEENASQKTEATNEEAEAQNQSLESMEISGELEEKKEEETAAQDA